MKPEMITKVVGELATVKLTKKLCDELLARCEHERKLKDRHAEFIRRSMVNSGWNNSSTISICEDGELLDGQHRLYALKQLGYPSINIQICTYRKKDVTPELRSSFNKAAKQTVSDTMQMCYGWTNTARVCSIYTSFVKMFIINPKSKSEMVCDELTMIQADKAFGEYLKYIPIRSIKGMNSFKSDVRAVFLAALVFSNSDPSVIELYKNAEGKFNCSSSRDIVARIHDYVFNSSDARGCCHGGEKYSSGHRILYTIIQYLNGKRTICELSKIKDDDLRYITDVVKPFIVKKFEEGNEF